MVGCATRTAATGTQAVALAGSRRVGELAGWRVNEGKGEEGKGEGETGETGDETGVY
jgi:hypothetical protein